jgi:preprotein translocase SecE subunit
MSETTPERQQRRAARRAERVPAAGAERDQRPAPAEQAERRKGNFVSNSWAELKKVEWPGQSQVVHSTVVVLVACIVVGAYLYANDQVWKVVVQKVFLGQ